MNANNNATRQAVSYHRFSSAIQGKGSSEERGQRDFERFCQSHNLTPFNRSFIDKGKSGFKGKHREGEFGAVLEMVENGSIPAGSVLVIEALDRFSREAVPEAVATWAKILRSGVDIGVCRNGRIFTKDDIGSMDMIMILMEMVMAHDYSAKLSKRLQASWDIRYAKLAKGERKAVTTVCPKWLQWNGTEFIFNEQADTMRKAVSLALDGFGLKGIRDTLGMKGKEFGGLANILRSRTLIGEFQNKKGTATQPGYYPALVNEDTFNRLQAAIDGRKLAKNNRSADKVTCLFTNLLHCQRSGGKMVIRITSRGETIVSVRNSDRVKGQKYGQMNYGILEKMLLNCFIRVESNDLQPSSVRIVSEVERLQSALLANERKTNELTELVLENENPALYSVLAKLGTQANELRTELESAKRSKAATDSVNHADTLDLIRRMAGMEGEELVILRNRLKTFIGNQVDRIDVETVTAKTCNIRLTFKSGCVFTLSADEWERTEKTIDQYNAMKAA